MAAEAVVDLGAIRHNVVALAAQADGATIAAVVKADGYGHGGFPVAEAALGAGAGWLAVATPDEAVMLGAAGIDDRTPVLILSESPAADLRESWGDLPGGVRFTVASAAGLATLNQLATAPVPVHLELDTGMHRMGADPIDARPLANAIAASPGCVLEGVWTHFAVADQLDDDFTAEQMRRFDTALSGIEADGVTPGLVHLCNSAGLIAHPSARRDLVRVGIALYGVAPAAALDGAVALRPALRLTAPVTAVRTVEAGESVSYGRHWFAETPTRVATVAIGYADGVRRDSPAAGVEVLVRGRRRPMLGVVTMDQVMVAVDDEVAVGDEAVVIGSQEGEEITVNEIAGRLDTIGYEVLTTIGSRVRRRHR